MSTGMRITLPRALELADSFRNLIGPARTCVRFEFAGSLRRKKADVGDFDAVAIPKFEDVPAADFFATPTRTNLLWHRVDELLTLGTFTKHVKDTVAGPRTKWGDKCRAIEFRGCAFEISIADPDNFGVWLAIRTGPGELSKDLVTRAGRLKGIRFAGDFHVEALREGMAPTLISLPEEEAFFKLVGCPFRPPESR